MARFIMVANWVFPSKVLGSWSLAIEKATNSCSMRRMKAVLLLASFSVGDWRPGSLQHGHSRCRSLQSWFEGSLNLRIWLYPEAAAVVATMGIKRFKYSSYLQHPPCDVLHSHSARWQVHCQTQTNPHEDKGINSSDVGVYLDADVIFLFL